MVFGRKGKKIGRKRKGTHHNCVNHVTVTPGTARPSSTFEFESGASKRKKKDPPLTGKKRTRNSVEHYGDMVATPAPKKVKVSTLLSEKDRRIGIAFHYIEAHKVAPEKEWWGSGGTVALICAKYPSCDSMTVGNVLADVMACYEEGKIYTAKRAAGSGGHNKEILPGSLEEQLVADMSEEGASYRQITETINEQRIKDSKEHLGKGGSAVRSCYWRLAPVITTVKKHKQGSSSPNGRWARASYYWAGQQLLRNDSVNFTWRDLGWFTGGPDPDFVDDGVDRTPPCVAPYFCQELLPHYTTSMLCHIDECHKQIFSGGLGAKIKKQSRFLRDKNGKLDPNGQLWPEKTENTFKYTEESRMGLLCVAPTVDGEISGRVGRPYFYSNKMIRTIKTMEELRRGLVTSIKGGGAKGWITGKRPKKGPGVEVFCDDLVDRLPGVGPKATTLLAGGGIQTVGELCNDDPNSVAEKIQRPPTTVKKWHGAALLATAGAYTSVLVDHRNAVDPFHSLHGTVEGEKVKDRTLESQGHVSIIHMLRFYDAEAKRLFEGTDQEGHAKIVHDALAQMCDKRCRQQCLDEGILQNWIVPENGLNDIVHYKDKDGNWQVDGSVASKSIFSRRPTGNNPEWMAFDDSLNNDLVSVADHLILKTKDLEDDDPKKFRRDTPRNSDLAFGRALGFMVEDVNVRRFDWVWKRDPRIPMTEGAVPAHRVAEDIKTTSEDNIRVRFEAQGAAVDTLRARVGHRRRVQPAGTRGGKRTKSTAEEVMTRWYHPDAESGTIATRVKSEKHYAGTATADEL